MEKLLSDIGDEGGLGLNWKGLYPKFGGLEASGASIGAGVRYWRREILGSPLEMQAQALLSIRKYQQYTFQFGRIMRYEVHRLIGTRGYGGRHNFIGLDKKDYDFFLFGTYRYRDYPQEDFFGLGPDSVEETRTDYRQKDSTILGTVGYEFTDWFMIAGSVGYMNVKLEPGEDSRYPNTDTVFDDVTAPGLFDETDFVVSGGTAVIDLRDNPSNPHSGYMFGFEHVRYDDTGDTNFSFGRTSYDARAYFPLFAEHRTLAFQLYTSMNNPDSGHRTPFYLMEGLGGADALRGFDTFRFRDDNLISLSGEYRWEPSPFWELALFYDAGKVFPNGESWNLDHLEGGYGIGLRFKLPKTTILRFDVGHSNEGTHVYFKLTSPSF
jgi:outer membrane protein assembly factor BamA